METTCTPDGGTGRSASWRCPRARRGDRRAVRSDLVRKARVLTSSRGTSISPRRGTLPCSLPMGSRANPRSRRGARGGRTGPPRCPERHVDGALKSATEAFTGSADLADGRAADCRSRAAYAARGLLRSVRFFRGSGQRVAIDRRQRRSEPSSPNGVGAHAARREESGPHRSASGRLGGCRHRALNTAEQRPARRAWTRLSCGDRLRLCSLPAVPRLQRECTQSL